MIQGNDALPGFGPFDAATGKPVMLAMQELCLSGTILPVGARLSIRHVFTAAGKKPIEVVYAFALPRDASLHSFRVLGKDFSVNSELRPVDEARKHYEEGIDAGHLSTLAQLYRDGVVNLNVGNIQPGETVAVYLDLAAGIEARDGGFRFRFPFTLAPAYHAQARPQLAGPDHGEIEVPPESFGDVILPTWVKDAKDLHRVGFDLCIETPNGLAEIASPSHVIRVHQGKERVRVSLATEKDVPNRDLVLDVRLADTEPIMLTGTDSEGCGRFAASIPSAEFGEVVDMPQRVVFLLDRSGSMAGIPLEQACRALEACLGALSSKDKFGLVAFDTSAQIFNKHLKAAKDSTRAEARTFLEGVKAGGGTELLVGVEAASAILGDEGGDIFLFTDGQVSGTEDIIRAAKTHNFRLHCLGIGSASQDRFLALLARETGGSSRFMTPQERVDMAAVELFSGSRSIVANEMECSVEGLAGAVVGPVPAQRAYGGIPVMILGRCAGEGSGHVRAAWKSDGRSCHKEWPLTVEKNPVGDVLKLIQGARLITDAEATMTDGPRYGRAAARTEQRQQRNLENISREYGLASRAMALVAVVKRASDQAGVLPTTSVVPVGMPQDTAFESYFSSCLGAPSATTHSSLSGPVLFCESSSAYPIPGNRRSRKGLLLSEASSPLSAMPCSPVSNKRKLQFQPAAAPAGEELLIGLASLLQEDGGLPGGDTGERIARSLAALLVFLSSGSTPALGVFAAHMRRLVMFLKTLDASALTQAQAELMNVILQNVHAGAGQSTNWLDLAEQCLSEPEDGGRALWKDLARAAKSPTGNK